MFHFSGLLLSSVVFRPLTSAAVLAAAVVVVVMMARAAVMPGVVDREEEWVTGEDFGGVG